MMTKLLLPKENLGQFVVTVDPNKSFYQQFKALLKKHQIDVFQCYLRDSFNRRYSMSKPMKLSGFYPGISLELHYDEEDSDEKINLNKIQSKPTKEDYLKIGFFFTHEDQNDDSEISVQVDRNSCIKNILLRDKLVDDQNIDRTYVLYNHQAYACTNTFDDIGVLDEAILEVVILNDDQIKQLRELEQQKATDRPVNDQGGSLQIDADIDDSKMSQQEYLYFVKQKQQWAKQMGKDRILTPEERKQLLINRQTRKATLSFKILTLSGQNLQKLRVSISSFSKVKELYLALREKINKILQSVNLQQVYQQNSNVKIIGTDQPNKQEDEQLQVVPQPKNDISTKQNSQKLNYNQRTGTQRLCDVTVADICQKFSLYTRTQNIEVPDEDFDAYEFFNGSDSIIVLRFDNIELDQTSIDLLYQVLM